jgi:hypothetical protein
MGILMIDEARLLYRAICCMQHGHLAMLPPGQRTHATEISAEPGAWK